MPRLFPGWFAAVLLACCTSNATPEVIREEPADRAAAASDPLGKFLNERGLAYEAPSGYVAVDVPASEGWAHVHAIRSSTHDVEVRYGAAPAVVAETLGDVCGDDARCAAAPSSAALEKMLVAAVSGLAAPGRVRVVEEFPLDAVRGEYGAHWGGRVDFGVDPALFTREEGTATVLHRVGHGSLMIVSLYREDRTGDSHEERSRAVHALRFVEPFAARASEHAELAGTFWECDEGLAHLRFEPTTLTRTLLSTRTVAEGIRTLAPYETEYAELTYLPGGRLATTPLRIDSEEQGERTPVVAGYSYERDGDRLTFRGEGWEGSWRCTRLPAPIQVRSRVRAIGARPRRGAD